MTDIKIPDQHAEALMDNPVLLWTIDDLIEKGHIKLTPTIIKRFIKNKLKYVAQLISLTIDEGYSQSLERCQEDDQDHGYINGIAGGTISLL